MKILHVAFVLFGCRAGFESPEIAALAGPRIDLAGIEPVLAGLQLADHGKAPFDILEGNNCRARSFRRPTMFEAAGPGGRRSGMYQMSQEAIDEIAAIIADAGKLPLDANAGGVRINRALSPEQWWAKYRYEREHAHERPMFGYLKRAKPRASDAVLKQAIIEAVKFYDDGEKYFKCDGDF